ncbi:OmpH family outer membrane protein [bacterium]|nr:OmpH family outer membrane protein [bacterium]QQR57143.1 MAG: OmpH family outer membrane protein [Candidatus Melainabacteria bacterium]
MQSAIRNLVLVSALLTASISPAMAQSAVSVKLGYFSLGMVRANYAEASTSEGLKAQAEAQLRQSAEEANSRIQKMREEKKPTEEIEKAIREAQTKLGAKQEALAQLVETSTSTVTAKIMQAANLVAKDKGVDIVVDGQHVFAGGQKFLDSGVDLTKEIIERLKSGNRSEPKAPAAKVPAAK